MALIPQEPIPTEPPVQLSIIAKALNNAGIAARIFLPTSLRATPNYAFWNVATDATIKEATSQSDASDSVYSSRFGVELVSPAFYDTDKEDWRIQVKTALKCVSDRVVWKANRSAGLHVHVGHGRNSKFILDQLKRLAMFICRFESALDSIRPTHRVHDNYNILSNRFNGLLKNLTIEDVFKSIRETKDVKGLAQVMNYVSGDEMAYDGYQDSKFFKVNFTSLLKHDTVEFCQHEGTVSGQTAVIWADFVLRFVRFAISATDGVVMSGGNSRDDLDALFTSPASAERFHVCHTFLLSLD